MPYYRHYWTAHEVPTDDKLNHIEEGIENATNAAESGSGGAGLPEVTAEDNGDVLTVVEGAWAKASPSGGDVFDIKFTATYDETTGDYTASCNKTIAEIVAEYQANGYDNIHVSLEYPPDSPAPLNLPVKLVISASGSIMACFIDFALADDEMYVIDVFAYLDQETQEDVVTYEEKVYLLTPSE